MFEFRNHKRTSATPCNPHDLVNRGARIVDVRSDREFAAGHIPFAVNIPLNELAQRLDEVGRPEDPVVVHCLSGGRSAAAANLLRQANYQSVCDLGAMANW